MYMHVPEPWCVGVWVCGYGYTCVARITQQQGMLEVALLMMIITSNPT